MSAGNIINFTNITFAINFAFQIVLQFNLFWLEIVRFAISVIDNNLNLFISSNFLVKIGILFVLFILSRRTLRFVYKLFTLKSNIVSNKPSEPENNDKAIDIDEFVAIYKYKNRGGFVNLLEDLTSISKLIISATNPN